MNWKSCLTKLLPLLLLLLAPAALQAQFTWTTNADNTITITGYTDSDTNVVIPDTISGMSVTSIGTNAFQGDGVSSVSIPNSVVSIGAAAFSECPITSFITPTNLTSIEDAVFDDCSHLTNIVFPDNVTNIGNEAFFMCSGLTSVIIPGKVTTIGEAAFFGCDSLTNIVIPASVSAIGNGAFSTCAFAGVTIPGSVTNLQGGTFSYCYELTNVTFLHSVYNIGDGAFYDCSGLTAVNFTGNAPSVASSFAFFGAPATVYYLPGTSGWDSFATNADVPIAPWHLPYPSILNFEPTFGVQSNQFGFTISWATNVSVIVDATTNLSRLDWQPVQTNALTDGSVYFSDPNWTNYPARFYRLRPAD